MVSANTYDKRLKIINQKCLADGRVLYKIEQFSNKGVVKYFEIDGQEVVEPRLNLIKNTQNWSSMQPNPLRWYSNHDGSAFGEINEHNRLHGRGISLNIGGICFGYFKNGR